jgi:hypothetical protein
LLFSCRYNLTPNLNIFFAPIEVSHVKRKATWSFADLSTFTAKDFPCGVEGWVTIGKSIKNDSKKATTMV